MGQQEVYAYLVYMRSKSDGWYTTAEICQALKERDMSNGALKGVSSDLYRLATFGQIQVKGRGLWKHEKVFRAFKR